MEYVKSFDILGADARQRPCLVEAGEPTASTVGTVGEFYMDSDTGAVYKCVAVSDDTYTWEAMGGAAQSAPIMLIESADKENRISLRSLENGTYILKGYFTAYEGSSASYTFATGMLVAILNSGDITYVQIFYPKNNTIQYLEISDTDVTRSDAKLALMESTTNKTTEIDQYADDYHYPSAKAVYDAIEALRKELQG